MLDSSFYKQHLLSYNVVKGGELMEAIMETLQRFLHFPITQLPYIIIALLIAFTVHEYSHAYMAYKFGDPTAKNQGRLTLNPAAHLDIVGTIMIFLAGFGWAKPVPVNYFLLKNKRYAGVLISIAGPLSNLLVATVFMGIQYALIKIGIFNYLGENILLPLFNAFFMIISLNIILFIFNLLPIPPLDGYRIIEDLAPADIRPQLVRLEQYGIFIFLLLIITPIGDYVFDPLFSKFHPFILESLSAFFAFIFQI